ncbi:MAG: hypothetical protein ABIQ09_16045 [Jatrophihabitantaceae bacterium]
MQNSNGSTGPTDQGDTPAGWQPTPEQPWRPVPDDDSGDPYQHDDGAPWCIDRAGHPQFHGGYPSLNHHRTECRSYDGWFGALDDDGRPGFLSAYLMRPFRFGQLGHAGDETRLAIEWEPAGDSGGGQLFRCTVHPASIRNLAAWLTHTADVEDGWRPPRHMQHSLTD